MTCQELAAGKLEGFLELRDGPGGLRRQSGFLLPPGARAVHPRWPQVVGAPRKCRCDWGGGCARAGKARGGKSLPPNLLRKVF